VSVSYLRTRQRRPWGAEPGIAPEIVPRTEHEETRRAARDWLRDRDDDNTDEFEREPPEYAY